MLCDWCGNPIGTQETGFFCLLHQQGGHLKCGFLHDQKEHANADKG